MRNKLGYLSLLSLLGLLGILTDNRTYLAFFSFLYYTKYFFVIPDELFMSNVRKAATPAFFTSLAASAVTIAIKVLLNDTALLPMGIGLNMALSLFVFTIILAHCEVSENGNNPL